MNNFSQARKNMVDCQIHTNGVIDPRVLYAFETLPRESYVPKEKSSVAYQDEDIIIDNGRILIEPHIHARMVQALKPKATDVALDIGGAYGYSSAVLSGMVQTVLALETNKYFLDKAAKLWNDHSPCNIVGIEGDLKQGSADNGPYDLIFVNGAVSEVPASWKAQLAENGRMVVVIKKQGNLMGEVTIIECLGKNQFSSYTVMSAATPYLKGFEPELEFTF